MPLEGEDIFARISGDNNGSDIKDGDGDVSPIGGLGGGDIEGFGGGVEGASPHDFETDVAGFSWVCGGVFRIISSSVSASLEDISGVASNSI